MITRSSERWLGFFRSHHAAGHQAQGSGQFAIGLVKLFGETGTGAQLQGGFFQWGTRKRVCRRRTQI